MSGQPSTDPRWKELIDCGHFFITYIPYPAPKKQQLQAVAAAVAAHEKEAYPSSIKSSVWQRKRKRKRKWMRKCSVQFSPVLCSRLCGHDLLLRILLPWCFAPPTSLPAGMHILCVNFHLRGKLLEMISKRVTSRDHTRASSILRRNMEIAFQEPPKRTLHLSVALFSICIS